MPMITELVNDSNVQVGNFSNKILNISYTKYSYYLQPYTAKIYNKVFRINRQKL